MTLFIKIIVKLSFVFLITFSFSAFCRPIGIVKSIKGRAFIFEKGEIIEATQGMSLSDFSSLSTEVGSQISISDYHDRVFHLSGQGNITFMKNLIELKSGYLWIQSSGPTTDVVLKTSNSQIVFNQGEGIVNYDSVKQKTQILVMSGYFDIANIEQSLLSERVQAGSFSFVQNNYENGTPRKSTPVGKSSYMKIVSLFENVEPIQKELVFGGRVTSYESQKIEKKPARFLASNSSPEDVLVDPLPEAKMIEKEFNKLNIKKKKKVIPTHPVKINIFRPLGVNVSKASTQMVKVERSPSSIAPVKIEIKQDQFEQDLIQQYKTQQKHDENLNELINDLDSYKQDYNTNY